MLSTYERRLIRISIFSLIEKNGQDGALWFVVSNIIDSYWHDNKITLKQKKRYDKIIDSFLLYDLEIFSFRGL